MVCTPPGGVIGGNRSQESHEQQKGGSSSTSVVTSKIKTRLSAKVHGKDKDADPELVVKGAPLTTPAETSGSSSTPETTSATGTGSSTATTTVGSPSSVKSQNTTSQQHHGTPPSGGLASSTTAVTPGSAKSTSSSRGGVASQQDEDVVVGGPSSNDTSGAGSGTSGAGNNANGGLIERSDSYVISDGSSGGSPDASARSSAGAMSATPQAGQPTPPPSLHADNKDAGGSDAMSGNSQPKVVASTPVTTRSRSGQSSHPAYGESNATGTSSTGYESTPGDRKEGGYMAPIHPGSSSRSHVMSTPHIRPGSGNNSNTTNSASSSMGNRGSMANNQNHGHPQSLVPPPPPPPPVPRSRSPVTTSRRGGRSSPTSLRSMSPTNSMHHHHNKQAMGPQGPQDQQVGSSGPGPGHGPGQGPPSLYGPPPTMRHHHSAPGHHHHPQHPSYHDAYGHRPSSRNSHQGEGSASANGSRPGSRGPAAPTPPPPGGSYPSHHGPRGGGYEDTTMNSGYHGDGRDYGDARGGRVRGDANYDPQDPSSASKSGNHRSHHHPHHPQQQQAYTQSPPSAAAAAAAAAAASSNGASGYYHHHEQNHHDGKPRDSHTWGSNNGNNDQGPANDSSRSSSPLSAAGGGGMRRVIGYPAGSAGARQQQQQQQRQRTSPYPEYQENYNKHHSSDRNTSDSAATTADRRDDSFNHPGRSNGSRYGSSPGGPMTSSSGNPSTFTPERIGRNVHNLHRPPPRSSDSGNGGEGNSQDLVHHREPSPPFHGHGSSSSEEHHPAAFPEDPKSTTSSTGDGRPNSGSHSDEGRYPPGTGNDSKSSRYSPFDHGARGRAPPPPGGRSSPSANFTIYHVSSTPSSQATTPARVSSGSGATPGGGGSGNGGGNNVNETSRTRVLGGSTPIHITQRSDKSSPSCSTSSSSSLMSTPSSAVRKSSGGGGSSKVGGMKHSLRSATGVGMSSTSSVSSVFRNTGVHSIKSASSGGDSKAGGWSGSGGASSSRYRSSHYQEDRDGGKHHGPDSPQRILLSLKTPSTLGSAGSTGAYDSSNANNNSSSNANSKSNDNAGNGSKGRDESASSSNTNTRRESRQGGEYGSPEDPPNLRQNSVIRRGNSALGIGTFDNQDFFLEGQQGSTSHSQPPISSSQSNGGGQRSPIKQKYSYMGYYGGQSPGGVGGGTVAVGGTMLEIAQSFSLFNPSSFDSLGEYPPYVGQQGGGQNHPPGAASMDGVNVFGASSFQGPGGVGGTPSRQEGEGNNSNSPSSGTMQRSNSQGYYHHQPPARAGSASGDRSIIQLGSLRSMGMSRSWGMSPQDSFGRVMSGIVGIESPSRGMSMGSMGGGDAYMTSPRGGHMRIGGPGASFAHPSPERVNTFGSHGGGMSQSFGALVGDGPSSAGGIIVGTSRQYSHDQYHSQQHPSPTRSLSKGLALDVGTPTDDFRFTPTSKPLPGFYRVLILVRQAFSECTFVLPGLKEAFERDSAGLIVDINGTAEAIGVARNSSPGEGGSSDVIERQKAAFLPEPSTPISGGASASDTSAKEGSHGASRQQQRQYKFPNPTKEEITVARRRITSAVCVFGGSCRVEKPGSSSNISDSQSSIFRSKDDSKIRQRAAEISKRQRTRYEQMLPGRYYENENRLSWEFEERPPVGSSFAMEESNGNDNQGGRDASNKRGNNSQDQGRGKDGGGNSAPNMSSVDNKIGSPRPGTDSTHKGDGATKASPMLSSSANKHTGSPSGTGISNSPAASTPSSSTSTSGDGVTSTTSSQPKMRYRCKLCGQPKQNHVCPYQQSLQRSIGTMVYSAVNAFTADEPGMLAPPLSEMNNFVVQETSSAENSPDRPSYHRGGGMGGGPPSVTPESLRSSLNQRVGINSPGSSISSPSHNHTTPFRKTATPNKGSPSRHGGPGYRNRSLYDRSSQGTPMTRKRNLAYISSSKSTDSGFGDEHQRGQKESEDLLFVDSMEIKPEQYRIVTPTPTQDPNAYHYPTLPLPYGQRKRLSDNLYAMSKEVPNLTNECAGVLREAREKDMWDLAVAELMTQVVTVLTCPLGDLRLNGMRLYLLSLGIAC